jgi:phosphatidylinositol glycan class Z
MAITFDTSFYRPDITTYLGVFRNPVITPLNNLMYNVATENLANHGLHPYYQHVVANLPLLLGPAYPLLLVFYRHSVRLYAAICALLVLSAFPHQEARFLLPAIPLVLSSVRLPTKYARAWISVWVCFNLVMGLLMGTYHQGGVVPAQIHIASNTTDINRVFWWKTYSPPIWLLDGRIEDIKTTDFMGLDAEKMVKDVLSSVACSRFSGKSTEGVVLVAPASATYLDRFTEAGSTESLILEERWRYSKHLNLDDLDIGEDGLFRTLYRVVGRRGLVLWNVKRRC